MSGSVFIKFVCISGSLLMSRGVDRACDVTILSCAQTNPPVREQSRDTSAHTSNAGGSQPKKVNRFEPAPTALRSALVLLGHPDSGHGTGFVISKKERLVATAAHVADGPLKRGLSLLAIPEGSTSVYRVDHVWYHPGIMRWLDEGLYARSDNPLDGEVTNGVPDVAVVQLSSDGPELPAECQLADESELKALENSLAGIWGYTKRARRLWRESGTETCAEFASGRINKVANVFGNAEAPEDQRQVVWFDLPFSEGMSGCPVFLANGRVAAIGATGEKDATGSNRDSGFRVDCLRELLAYHKLPGQPIRESERTRQRPDWGPDPRLESFRKAAYLVREANQLRQGAMFRQASEACNEAIGLAPAYAGAFLQRSKVYLYYLGTQWDLIPSEERIRFAEWASIDAYHCIEIFPEWNAPYLFYMQSIVYVAQLRPDPSCLHRALVTLEKVLRTDWPNDPLTDGERSFAINCRAQCHHFLGEMDEAEKDYDESIVLAPLEARWYLNRAQYWDHKNKPDRALSDREMAQELRGSQRNRGGKSGTE